MLKLCGNNHYGKSDIAEISPPLLHLLTLTPPVIMLVKNARCHIRTITDNLFRNIAVQVVSDPTTAESVWTHSGFGDDTDPSV